MSVELPAYVMSRSEYNDESARMIRNCFDSDQAEAIIQNQYPKSPQAAELELRHRGLITSVTDYRQTRGRYVESKTIDFERELESLQDFTGQTGFTAEDIDNMAARLVVRGYLNGTAHEAKRNRISYVEQERRFCDQASQEAG
ncbi:hypothetical protein [Gimesia panareensis]|uniref:hypothetical protein n=1 Tax=Gimesia panareensis TaxID=2527978 RepID=UPI00118A3933|nr:hypothetical protein [Gimesia panareensis]QDU50867.1 hypothetical protein Pan110_32280 [Gimesia panareensis]